MPLTYLQFHLVALLPALLVLGAAVGGRTRGRVRDFPPRLRWAGIGLLTVVALLYTTPWDNYLIERGVWWYGEGRVVARVWLAPVEEYLFIVVQPILTGLWLWLLPTASPVERVERSARVSGTVAGLAVGVVGAAMLHHPPTFYLGAILAWAAPVLALQWGFGWPVLWERRRTLALGVLVPSLYLAAADRVAIELEVWSLSSELTTGITVAGLPVEEGLFFVVTNLFVVQGLLLFEWVVRRWR